MAELTLVGASADGRRLLLLDDAGTEYTLVVDARLRAALRGDHARLGQLEIDMDSALRPRDIQARIRAGEPPEAVAQAAQTTLDRIMPFVAPVLAEREHMAERAQTASVRRKAGDTGARTLGEAVATQLRQLNVSPGVVTWDAWKREDGRWQLTAAYAAGRAKGLSRFAYDVPGNFVVAENDDARWLIGEEVAAAPAGPARSRVRRLTAVPDEAELPLGDDALALVRDTDLAPSTDETPPETAETTAEPDEEQTGSFLDTVLSREDTPPEEAAPEPPPRRVIRKNRGRASVPSWDEIMFGGNEPD